MNDDMDSKFQVPATNATQLNIALKQRCAGRNYHEYFVPGSIKLLLATTSKGKLDELAIDNEHLFKYRFGFKATPAVSHQVIAFKNKYNLFDDEIRYLKRVGYLKVTRQELTINTSLTMPICGWLQIIGISFIFLPMVIQIAGLERVIELKRSLIQVSLLALWLGLTSILFKTFVMSWHILKNSGEINLTS